MNIFKLPKYLKHVKLLIIDFLGRGIFLIAHILRRRLLSALVLWIRYGEIDEIFNPELRINLGLILIEESRDIPKIGFIAREKISNTIQMGRHSRRPYRLP